MNIKCTRLNLQQLFPDRRDAFAVIVDGLFSPSECEELIRQTEEIGYSEALVGGSQVRVAEARNNWRCMIDDVDLAGRIYRKVLPYIPTSWLGYNPAGLNERLRFLKYHPGEYFKPHNDGIFVRADGSQASFITVQVYLNDVPEGSGGETTFTTEGMTYGRHKKKTRNQASTGAPMKLRVRPVIGRVLIFEHHLPHEGSTLIDGVKYAMRTDVMYDLRVTEPSAAPGGDRGTLTPNTLWDQLRAELPIHDLS
jgi:predicted 2-oxoglutarate/Fe(II)-dependent dioxygenase YbiX